MKVGDFVAKSLAIEYNNRKTDFVMGEINVRECPHIPNAETLAAMKEADERLRQLEAGEIQPRFNNLVEFFISLFSEDDEE